MEPVEIKRPKRGELPSEWVFDFSFFTVNVYVLLVRCLNELTWSRYGNTSLA